MAMRLPTVQGADAAEPGGFILSASSRMHTSPVRAEIPHPPASTSQTRKADAARAQQKSLQESLEKRHMLRGLLLLAGLVLLGSMLHAGSERVFVPGWWRQW